MKIEAELLKNVPASFNVVGIMEIENGCHDLPVLLIKSDQKYYSCMCPCGRKITNGREKPGAAIDEFIRRKI